MKNNKSKPLVIIQCYEDRQQTLPLRKAEYDTTDAATNNHAPLKREATDNPPPPPPMPNTNGQQNGDSKSNHKSITKPFNSDVIKSLNVRNGTLTRTPTPDYNNKTDNVQSNFKGKDEKAELESLESYKLKNPTTVLPKPPSTYFMRAPNGTATMKKIARPVSVTIGEYAGGGNRREPIKLDFLSGDKSDGNNETDDVPITNRLQSELALTLSRSNLRKKTEALDNGISDRYYRATNDDSDASIDKNFHARYGNNILPLPPSVTIPKVTKLKTHVI
ncbi:unnamed protein product [Diatraea saccharalis]|uniref:Uncharacterized protein n=1 Tax=Diatraea saccharalis TaxID=40085 RepID=A0A9N9WHG7_9NEOP|nr:unnamed protein product [Diatraea saccharalis]